MVGILNMESQKHHSAAEPQPKLSTSKKPISHG